MQRQWSPPAPPQPSDHLVGLTNERRAIPGRPDHRSSSRYEIQSSDEACSPGGSMNAGVFEPGGWTHFSYPCQPLRHLCPQSSSVSRFAAGAFGFLSQSFGGQLTAIAMMVIGYLVWLLVQ
jgi:hypothetical protein